MILMIVIGVSLMFGGNLEASFIFSLVTTVDLLEGPLNFVTYMIEEFYTYKKAVTRIK